MPKESTAPATHAENRPCFSSLLLHPQLEIPVSVAWLGETSTDRYTGAQKLIPRLVLIGGLPAHQEPHLRPQQTFPLITDIACHGGNPDGALAVKVKKRP